jgi:DNA sulfur modification protein DndC
LRLKIRPLARFQRALRKRYGSVASIVGMRMDESENRKRRMERLLRGFELKDKEAPVPTFVPAFDILTEEVFSFIAEREPSLYSLYSRAGGKEARFGCFVCPLVKEDKSLKALSDNYPSLKPYLELREFLLSADKPENRGRFSKKGKDLGKGKGFLLFAVRKEIFRRVKAFEKQTGVKLIGLKEERCIYNFWEEERQKGILE